MAWGLDNIKEGLKSLEKGITETARSATNTGGMKGTSLKKEKMKSWSKSKEGVALIDVALSLGLSATASASKSADTAESFINDAYDKKDELMELGRKLVDKKSYEAGEKALDLSAEVGDFVKKHTKDFGKSSMTTAEKMRAVQPDTGPSFLDTLKEAKKSSVEYTSKLVKEVSDNAEAFKKDLSEKHDVKVSAIDMMLEKSGNDVSKVIADISDLANKTAEELATMGITKIEGYTRKDGGKVPTHFRKRAR